MKEYDAIISLGGACATAMQLNRRGLRPYSLALDWVAYSPDFIPMLGFGFETDFRDFCLKENLSPVVLHNGAKGWYDSYYRLHHIHTFKSVSLDECYEKDYSTIRRRIRRMLERINASDSILFLLATYYEFDLQLAFDLMRKIEKRYPGKHIDMRVAQFAAQKGPYCRNVGYGNVECYKYPRELGSYDLEQTSAEWMFMDELSLRIRQRKKSVPIIQRIVGLLFGKKRCTSENNQ